MAHLIVGDKDTCGFNLVLRTMKKDPTFGDIVAKRRDIAVELNIDKQVLDIIDKNYKLLDEGALPIMQKYLECWRSALAEQATLGTLLSALDACELNGISNTVRKADFYVKASKSRPSNVPGHTQQVLDDQNLQHHNVSAQLPRVGNDQSGLLTTQNLLPNYSGQGEDVPDKLSNEVTAKEVEQEATILTDGIMGFLASKILSNNGKIVKEEWNSRTFVVGDNLKVSLKKRQLKDPKLGEGRYALPGKRNGYALILNIIHYPKNRQEPYRAGAQYDSLKLTELLTQLEYEVVKFDDPNWLYSKSDVEQIIQQFRELIRKKEEKPASIVVFVGGHGTYGGIDMSDGKSAKLFESIVYQFGSNICPALKNVPKIFIVNSCRVAHRTDSIPNKIEDAVVCYAALPLNLAFRSPNNGSIFVNSLITTLAENAHNKHFTQMMKMVSTDVRRQMIQPEGEKQSNELQQPMHEKLGDFGKLYFNV